MSTWGFMSLCVPSVSLLKPVPSVLITQIAVLQGDASFTPRKKTSRSPVFDHDGLLSPPVVSGLPSGCPNRPTCIRPLRA